MPLHRRGARDRSRLISQASCGQTKCSPGLRVGEQLPNLHSGVPRKVRVESRQEHDATTPPGLDFVLVHGSAPGVQETSGQSPLELRPGSAPAMDSLSRAGSLPALGRDKRRADATAVAEGLAGRSSRPSAPSGIRFQSSLCLSSSVASRVCRSRCGMNSAAFAEKTSEHQGWNASREARAQSPRGFAPCALCFAAP